MHECEGTNRTRVAGHLDEIQGVVANLLNLFRNGAVGFIDWLDRLRCIINCFALPRVRNRIANGAPSNRQIGKLQNRRVKLNNFVQRNNPAVLGRAIALTDELPAVIV